MTNMQQLQIISRQGGESSSKISLEEKTFHIESEDLGVRKHTLITRVFHKGKVYSSYDIDYADILGSPDFEIRLAELMRVQQNKAIVNLKRIHVEQGKTWRDCVKEVEVLISIGNQKEALTSIGRAMTYHPNNPVICSYWGLLNTVVNRDYTEGINLCHHAIKILKESMLLGESFFLPVLYLNLGKSCIVAGKKRQALDAFRKGLEFDNKNKSLRAELQKLGIRKKPTLPFLKRSNVINRGLGKLRQAFRNN